MRGWPGVGVSVGFRSTEYGSCPSSCSSGSGGGWALWERKVDECVRDAYCDGVKSEIERACSAERRLTRTRRGVAGCGGDTTYMGLGGDDDGAEGRGECKGPPVGGTGECAGDGAGAVDDANDSGIGVGWW